MPFKLLLTALFATASFGCSKETTSSLFANENPNYIEGAQASALKDNEALLKSVVHFANLKNGSCTATLIKKDVLLTAKHCVDIYNPKGIINSVEATSIQTIVSPDTDLALVKFVTNSALNKKLVGAKPIEIATAVDQGLYADSVLLAGYGMTSEDSTSGTLYAGKNKVIENDPVTVALFETLYGPQSGSKYPFRSNYIHLLAKRMTNYESFQYVEGFTVSKDGGLYYSIIPGKDQFPEGTSMALPGDSGGPLMAFKDGVASVIGVASDVCLMCAGSLVKEVKIIDQRLETTKTITVDATFAENGRSINATLLKVLADAGVLIEDPNQKEGYITNTDFVFEFKLDRMVVNGYVATGHDENAKFIAATLKKFGY